MLKNTIILLTRLVKKTFRSCVSLCLFIACLHWFIRVYVGFSLMTSLRHSRTELQNALIGKIISYRYCSVCKATY
jgi:hypothetical protein